MSDLIDRHKAIMDAESWVAVDECEKHLQKNVIEWLKEFPPAELGVGTDTISRQQAIDAAKDWYEGLICGSINGLIKRLNALPPVQPEPKKGHWIWVAGDLECSKCHTRYPDLYPDYDNAVACPHCGCKMEVEHDSDLHAE